MTTRDMSKTEFAAALRRNGFRHTFMWWYEDTTGQTPGYGYGAVLHADRSGIDRRMTVARLIRDREKAVAELKQASRRAAA